MSRLLEAVPYGTRLLQWDTLTPTNTLIPLHPLLCSCPRACRTGHTKAGDRLESPCLAHSMSESRLPSLGTLSKGKILTSGVGLPASVFMCHMACGEPAVPQHPAQVGSAQPRQRHTSPHHPF